MKLLITVVAGLLLPLAVAAAPVSHTRSWSETHAVAAATPTLEVGNIWGSVRVRRGASGHITVSIDERRSAPDAERYERSLQVLPLEVTATAAGVSFVVGVRDKRWQQLDACHGCRVDYQFDIEVPPGTRLDVGTVMDGTVDVDGVAGTVSASNVNGPVKITGIGNCRDVGSVNGDVDIAFARAPVEDCRIETINGDITLDVPGGAGLDVALDLFNGEVSTELAFESFALPATVERAVEDGRRTYRLQRLAGLRFGAGGPVYTVTSMNGDLRIKNP